MPGVARLGDSIQGTTSGEHGGHYDIDGYPLHGSGTITGTIVSGCSTNVFINGKNAAVVGALTNESDNCDSGQTGTISIGSSNVFVNGKALARNGDSITPHNGTAFISSGSSDVFVNS
ncbi:PAAR motif protein [compost metagenome]